MFAFVPAVQSQGVSEADMQDMMQMMQKMQECMAKVDQSALEGLEKRSEELEAEIKSLCEQGKKKKAQKKAIAFGKEMMDNPALKQMRKCSEITKGLLPEGSAPQPSFEDEFDFSNQDICDD
jgi:dsDNA-specific endonuclease/ATPase MutS2